MRAAQRQQEIHAVADLDRELIRIASMHEVAFPPAQPPAPLPEPPIDTDAILERVQADELRGLSRFKRAERREALDRAQVKAAQEIEAAREAGRERTTEEETRRGDAWRALRRNDPTSVLGTLEAAFADNHSPAAATRVSGNAVDLVMYWPPLESVVGERKIAVTPSGKPTHHKRSQTERNALYLEMMASNVLATVKEAFAVAPAIEQARLLVIRRGQRNTSRSGIDALFAGQFHREALAPLRWSEINPASEILNLPGAALNLKGRTNEVAAIDVTADEELSVVLDELSRSLGWTGAAPQVGADVAADGVIDIEGDSVELDGLRRACISALESLAERTDPAIVSAEEHLLFVLEPERGRRQMAVLKFEGEGDERLAEVLEAVEEHRPAAAGYAFPVGNGLMGLALCDRSGNEASKTLDLAADLPLLETATPRPDEAVVLGAALRRLASQSQ